MAHAGTEVIAVDESVHQKRWWALAALSMSLVMIVMDNTILNVALPHLSRDLAASTSQLQWIIDSYTIVFAGLLLSLGALGDRRGRRTALLGGLVIFGAGSAAATFADSANFLIGARGIMGIGGALIMPATLSIVANIFRDPRERAKAISIWSAMSGIGVVVGPLLGGYLLKHFAWSSVFWINVPLAVAMIVAVSALVPQSKAATSNPTDWGGVVLSTAGIVAMLFGIIQGPEHGWTSATIVGALVLAVVLLVGFVAWELRNPRPMLDVRFFTNPRFSAANLSVTLAMFGMFGSMFLMSQLLQFVQGLDPLAAGVRMIPFAIGIGLGTPAGNYGDRRFGTKLTVATGLAISALGLLTFTRLDADTGYVSLLISILIMAVGMGLVFGPATESVMGSLPPDQAGVGSAINDTTRELGGALGVAVIGSAMSAVYAGQVATSLAASGLPAEVTRQAERSLAVALAVAQKLGGDAGAGITKAASDAFVAGMHRGVVIGSIAMGLAALTALLFLPARAPEAAIVDQISEDDLRDLDEPFPFDELVG